MSTEIKNTLFRFVTMRAPQLSDDKNKESRFVFRDKSLKEGDFDIAVKKEGTITKWNKMMAIVPTFEPNSIKTEDKISEINTSLFQFSVWLARNKYTCTNNELLLNAKKVNYTNDTKQAIPFNLLWDNLFYQVITQKDFYIKECIIQLLVALNFLDKFSDKDDKLNQDLINAIVVLPESLFVEKSINNTIASKILNREKEAVPTFPSNEMVMLQKRTVAKQKNESYKKLKSELLKLEKAYRKEYQLSYNRSLQEYQSKTKPVIDQYYNDLEIEKQKWCSVRDPKIVYDNANPCNEPPRIALPDIPKFEFEFRNEIDFNELEAKLTIESYNALKELYTVNQINVAGKIEVPVDPVTDYDGVTEYGEILIEINSSSNGNDIEIFDNTTPETTTTVLINNTPITVSNTTNVIAPFTVEVCPNLLIFGQIVNFTFKIEVPDITWIVKPSGSFTKLLGVGIDPNYLYVESTNGTSIKLANLVNYSVLDSNTTTGMVGTIEFTNGETLNFNFPSTQSASIFDSCYKGTLNGYTNPNPNVGNSSSLNENTAFIPSGFGMKQLGIADYKKVEQSVQCYVEGEVANIENVMARERREKSTRRLRRSENTEIYSSDTEREKITDTTTTDRFEMQSEVAKVIQESKDFSANAYFNSDAFKISFGGSASYATHSSQEVNTRQAITQAKEITTKASDRITTKIHEERIIKITEEFEENNIHEFDNRKGDKHVVGVYRWVDKVYKNQVVNYGKRLMFEFMIPEPAKLHILAMANTTNATLLIKPVDPRISSTFQLKDYGTLNDMNLKYWTSYYNIDFSKELDQQIKISHSFSDKSLGIDDDGYGRFSGAFNNNDIKIPEHYQATRVEGNVNPGSGVYFDGDVSAGGNIYIGGNPVAGKVDLTLDNVKNNLSISGTFWDVKVISGSFIVTCILTPEYNKKWKQDTFKAIINKYEEALELYNQKLEDENAKAINVKETNPGFYRQIENTILRKNCISYMIDQTSTAKNTYGKDLSNGKASFKNYEIRVDKTLDDYAALVKFMEQAFEWDIMSYNFYPFYWGKKDNWAMLYQNDNNDPLFRSFMQSGMARTVVTVRPGFEEAVRFYLQTGQIWNGGEVPVIEDKLFMSIVDELREPEGKKEGKAWATRVPTTLTILQANSIGLQVEKALPCNCDDVNAITFENPEEIPCAENFVLNNAQINGDAGTARIFGKIEGNNNIKAVITLKTLEGLVQEVTICDEDGNWEITALPAGKYELLIDSTNKFSNGVYLVTNGQKENLIELEKAQTQEFNITVTDIIK